MEWIIGVFGFAIAIALFFFAFRTGLSFGAFRERRKWELELPSIRKDATKKSRAVLGGQFSEQLAPYLPNFPYVPTEVRFIGKPIDFLVFKGMDNKHIEEVVFVEVKSGKSQLSTHERKLRDAIQAKRVSWEEYRIPEEITKYE